MFPREYLNTMKNFDENHLPSLSVCTLGALELFIEEGIPSLDLSQFKNPLFVGSGNAIATAKIVAQERGKDFESVFFADENSYKEINLKKIDGAVIFSASGEKHAKIIAEYLKKKGIKTYLLTCSSNSSAEKILGKEHTIVTKKNREPYTYNTSTYLGWVLASTQESPIKILDFIHKEIEPKIPKSLNFYDGFVLVTPEKLSLVNHLFDVKFKELFGRKIARDITTYEALKHAVTVIEDEHELAIEFGDEVSIYSREKLKIKLPKNVGPGALMAIGYYVIGKIQEQHPQYFRNNIEQYILEMNKSKFGKNLKVIVE